MSESDFLPLGDAQALTDSLSGTAAVDPKLSRSNYFDGRLLRARDLTRDQMYLDFRLREYGKSLGGGVVTGLDLTFDDTAGERFTISPGIGVTDAGRTLETPEILKPQRTEHRAPIPRSLRRSSAIVVGAIARIPAGLSNGVQRVARLQWRFGVAAVSDGAGLAMCGATLPAGSLRRERYKRDCHCAGRSVCTNDTGG